MNSKYYIFLFCLLNTSLTAILKPENNASLNYTHVLFEWEQIESTLSYELQISSDNLFSDIV